MKRILIAATLLAVLPAMTVAKDKSSAAKSDQEALIQETKSAITACKKSYREFVIVSSARQMLIADQDTVRRRAQGLNMDLGDRLTPPPPVTPIYLDCIAEQKNAVMPKAKGFIASFKSADAKSNARAMLAQWITTMDAIGKEVGQAEEAKFETLANGLLIDIQ